MARGKKRRSRATDGVFLNKAKNKMFKNRNQAGKTLAKKLTQEVTFEKDKTIVVSLPRGGVVIGAIVAALVDLPHQALITKKISLPSNPELAIGATASSQKSLFLNKKLINQLGVQPEELKKAITDTRRKIKAVEEKLNLTDKLKLKGKTVIVIDDGAATGATMFSAIRKVKSAGADRIIVSLPVAPPDTVQKLKQRADNVIVAEQPQLFFSVSQFYEDFPQVEWEEVINLLKLPQKK